MFILKGQAQMLLGLANEKFSAEQEEMIAKLKKSEGGNNASLGDDGELLVIRFLNRFLPPQFRAYKGHYRKIDGTLSREIDVMILDSRFPLLNETESGVVYAMQHALLATIEVKRTLGEPEIKSIRENTISTQNDKAQVPEIGFKNIYWSRPESLAFAFRSRSTLKTMASHFFIAPVAWCDIYILEHDFECGGSDRGIGALVRVEQEIIGQKGMTCRTENPLSDFYYMALEKSFDVLSERNVPDGAMQEIISAYYNWSNIKESFEWYQCPMPQKQKKVATVSSKDGSKSKTTRQKKTATKKSKTNS